MRRFLELGVTSPFIAPKGENHGPIAPLTRQATVLRLLCRCTSTRRTDEAGQRVLKIIKTRYGNLKETHL
jgi:hypothetical protein